MRILLVEDDKKLAGYVKKGLCEEQYAVDVQHDGLGGLSWAREIEYDLIILDLMLPGKDGLAICREIRKIGRQTPILMLTAKDTIADKVNGLDSGADAEHAIFSITDTGIGISEDAVPTIFDRFYRVEQSRSHDTGGSGLGLAIAQKIVALHGGSIAVQSTVQQGTTFRVSWPCAVS